MSNSRKLIVEIVGDSSKLEKTFKRTESSAKGFGTALNVSLGSVAKIAALIGGLTAINKAVHASIDEFSQQQKIAAQTEAVIASTGKAAGVSARQVEVLGKRLSNLSGIDDEVIKAGENVLLSFTQIRNAAGQGNDIFNQATKAAVDFAARTGRAVPAAAQVLGKALADPATKLSSLARAGVVFTAQQIKQVAAIQKTRGVLEAQKVVLGELEKRFGGAAKALGDTVPGQLNVIRERLRDIGGDLIGVVAPGFASALKGVTDFVRKLSEIQGARAKFTFVVDGIQNLGRDLFNQIRESLANIDFAASVSVVQEQLVAGLNRISGAINRVDWSHVGRAVGDGIATGLAGTAAFLQSVDWGIVGRRIVQGIRAFLEGVNWKAVAVATVKTLVAAFTAVNQLLNAAGRELAKALYDGIVAGLSELGRQAEILALKIVKRIVGALDFKVLGHNIVPGVGKIVDGINARLDELGLHASAAEKALDEALKKPAAAVNRSAAIDTAPAARKTRTQQAVLDTTAPVLAATTAVESAADKAKKAFDRLLQSLQIGVERASLTKPLGDDLAAIGKVIAALRKRASVAKGDLDVQRDLVQALGQQQTLLQQQADLVKQARDAKQFQALGLAADGSQLVPQREGLLRHLGQLSEKIVGTVADSAKNNKTLAAIRKLLLDPTVKVSREVRSTVKGMLDDIASQLKDASSGPLTKTRLLDTSKLVSGLGLDRATANQLRARLSQFNTAGVALAGANGAAGAFGTRIPSLTVKAPDVYLDGQKISTSSRQYNTVHARRNPKQKRGNRF